MKTYIVLENIRSAFNVGNVIRTADALGFDVILSGYTPSPFEDDKVKKSSLGAENNIQILQFRDTKETIDYLKSKGYNIFSAEITNDAVPLNNYFHVAGDSKKVAIVFGNEVSGVLPQTLDNVDKIFYIPMNGIKESLNIGQSAAIFMREIYKTIHKL
ncbi:MAG: TrmH family RNA methyltransferase [Candidatus Absconditabacteria bacterium]